MTEPAWEAPLEFLVGPDDEGTRLDVFLGAKEGLPTRSACARLIGEGRVSINATPATSKSERLVLGDRVAVAASPTARADGGAAGTIVPNFEIDLDVRFEDAWLIVLSKQAGLVCHPSPGHVDDTLANALVAHCGPERLGRLQGDDRPGIVHRLDMDTSGLMVAAKDDGTQRALQDLIRLRVLDRRYVTLVHGYVRPDESTITTGIARSPRDRLRMAVSDDPGAREAITTFRTLERFCAGRNDDGYSLLECHLYTGRTHQIRVHMGHVGHPVVGDQLYGRRRPKRGPDPNLGLARQFLHSWRIGFEHPVTGEEIRLSDTLPPDLSDILQSLEDRTMGRTAAGERICPLLVRG